jgi:single-strand DNA-binding protein
MATNHITILGRLTKDPEIRYTPSQKVVASIVLAVDRPFTGADGKREADFIPVVIWGKTAELVGNSCAKGHRLLVEGRLQIRNFDAKDGTKHWVTEVVANSVEFIERKEQKTMSNLGKEVPFDEEVSF